MGWKDFGNNLVGAIGAATSRRSLKKDQPNDIGQDGRIDSKKIAMQAAEDANVHQRSHRVTEFQENEGHAPRASLASDKTVLSDPNEYSDHMFIDRVKLLDVNGLVGKMHRHSITGSVFLKEVESWRDFALVDLFTRKQIHGTTEELAEDTSLFKPRPLPARTWIYHCKFRQAFEKFQIGLNTEAFLYEALASRCIDVPVWNGQWSPFMIYTPLIPFTLLADDSMVLLATAALACASLLSGLVANNHSLYFYQRAALLPLRLGFMVFVAIRMTSDDEQVESSEEEDGGGGGGGLQMAGYIIALVASLLDILLGDVIMLTSMKTHCSYELLRTLPKQVFVCKRIGDSHLFRGKKEKPRIIPERITGMKDPGDGSVCLIANVQGLLVLLEPVIPEDKDTFINEDQLRRSYPDLENMKFYGVDLFDPQTKTLQELWERDDKTNPHLKMLHAQEKKSEPKRFGAKKNDMTVEDA